MMSGRRECSLPIVDRTMLESSRLTWPDILEAAYDYGLVDEDDIQRYVCGEYGVDELRQLCYDLFSDRSVVGGRRTRWGDLSLRGYYAPSQFPRRPFQYRLRRTQSYPNVNLVRCHFHLIWPQTKSHALVGSLGIKNGGANSSEITKMQLTGRFVKEGVFECVLFKYFNKDNLKRMEMR